MRPYLVLLMIAVIWRVVYGDETFGSMQEANHENVTNSSVIEERRVARSDLGQGESEESPPPFWANRGRSLNFSGERLRRHEPFFVEEPDWLVLQEQRQIPDEGSKHSECQESRKRRTSLLNGVDEAFWPSRGRRSGYKRSVMPDEKSGMTEQGLSTIANMFHSTANKYPTDPSKNHNEHHRPLETRSVEEPFWAARGRSVLLDPRNLRSGFMESIEEPFWAARGRRSGDLAVGRRSEAFSGEEPFWAARGRRSVDSVRGRRSEAFSGEEPFWAARGRRSVDSVRGRRSEAFSGEEPFWAARGRRSEDPITDKRSEAFSGEEPFWAARGRRAGSEMEDVHDSLKEKSPSWRIRTNFLGRPESNFLEMARGRRSPQQREHLHSFSGEEPFWAARGKRGVPTSAEEPFWAARGKKQFPQINNWNSKWWPMRGIQEAITVADNNAEDESFWTALENKLMARGPVYDMVPM